MVLQHFEVAVLAVAIAEHARPVVNIIESAYRSSEIGRTQKLRTTF